MTQGRSILFLGATGYIGSTALDRIAKADPNASITIYGRNPKVLKGFEEVDARFKGVQGTLEEHDKLTALAASHDVTVNCADADSIDAIRALLRGLKQRHAETGTPPVFIHTSGTGVLSDNAEGEFAGDKIYTDAGAEPSKLPPWLPISALSHDALHRDVDLEIEAADREGYALTYIVLPSTIYGIVSHVFADRGLSNPQSQQVPHLTRWSIDRRAGAVIGAGANLWPNVHIDDTGDLFALVYGLAIRGGDHGADGYFFAESGEHTLKQVGDAIGAALYAKGLADTPEARTLTGAELDKYAGGSKYLGGNSRARGVHSRAIGWKPTHGLDDFLKEIATDVEWTLAHDRGKGADGNWVFGPGPIRVGDGWRMPEGDDRMK
ncbi:hypothetical protein VHUM_04066 [Vanrija humicola]|uniref:Saccharopine dehydrogenase NADP binding domain-containing protein n=1 Tax=Vanrija humicola TaxID=5417 RepID=A0A7D8YUQ3_VANHU|nr:hypothetical protein VHUM_04066 [Vanrija humicola]